VRLDFNVLWIDNQPKNVESYQERLDIKVQTEGFRLRVVPALSFEEAAPHLADDIFRDDIDLVLVDWDLGAGAKGDQAVREIRAIVPYKDIIFYSSIDNAALKAMILEQGVEGVFCAHRDDLADTLIGVFESLVKKVLDVDHSRGIVMGATSDIDHIANDCLSALAPLLVEEHRGKAFAYALTKIDARLARFQKTRDEIAAAQSIDALIAAHEAFPAADRLKLLKEVLGLHYENNHGPLRTAVGHYINDVPPKRNKLGHVRLVAESARRVLRGKGNQTVSPEELRQLRSDLVRYRDTFEDLAALVGLTLD